MKGGTRQEPYERHSSGRWLCAFFIIAIIAAVIVIVVLALTVFRVRDPRVTVQSVQLTGFTLTFSNSGPQLNFAMNIVVAVKNRNHASFKYRPSTANIFYRGATVGTGAIPAGTVKAEKTTTIASQVQVFPAAFLGNPSIAGDVQSGTIPLVVQTTLVGRVDVAGIVKHHATVVSTCNLNVLIQTQSVGGVSCNNQFHL